MKPWPRRIRKPAAAALLLLAAIGGNGAVAAPDRAADRAPDHTSAAEAASPDVRYVVRPGDNLFRFAANYLVRTDDYRIVQKLNRVADPLRLPVGMVLVIPRRLLRHEAVKGTVHSMRGAVRIGGKPASVGMAVGEGMLIETGQKSFVTLTLPDATTIALPSQSAVRVQRLRRVVFESHVERLFAIEHGRASATVTPMTDPLSDFRFSTPRAVTSVRGTHFRMGYDAQAGLATSEVLEGKVGFDTGQDSTQTLPAGFGTTSELASPVALLPAPEFLMPGTPQTADGLFFALKPLPGAVAYHVQIARDDRFLEVVDEATSTSSQVRFASLPDGAYFVRATAIDSNELEGEPAGYRFQRQLQRMRMGIDMGWVGPYRQYLFWWDTRDATSARFRFQLAKAGKEERPIVDMPELSNTSQTVIDIPRGRYRWRVQTSRVVEGKISAEWSDYGELRVESR
ncbi:FecR domain-containing protein [Novosphingobium guangzhouense]|uniref:FecR domain-containing protein n=1 Tax=Novosphingobium guangzhouense TaxID=1850347 RepID=UPI001FE8E022|nr:FecR domain-containing protein [Novosphingobium guangzhouense]